MAEEDRRVPKLSLAELYGTDHTIAARDARAILNPALAFHHLVPLN